jgi:hypothetical protein
MLAAIDHESDIYLEFKLRKKQLIRFFKKLLSEYWQSFECEKHAKGQHQRRALMNMQITVLLISF